MQVRHHLRNFSYTISSIEDKIVVVDKGDNKYTGDIKIPSSVIFKEKEMKVQALGWASFSSSDVSSIEIAEGVLEIGAYCFKDCYSLKSIRLANSIESIGENAFEGCVSLGEIVMPSSLKGLGHRSFKDCNNLQNVVISSSLENLGDYIFYGCDNLNYLKIPKTIKKIGYAFVTSIDVLELEEGEDSLYCEHGNMDESTHGMSSVDFYGAFSGSSIRKLILGRNLSYKEGDYDAHLAYNFIYNYQPPFYKCRSIKSLVIKDNIGKLPPFDYSDIDTIVCKATTPIRIPENTFTHSTYVNGALYVPIGSKKMYEVADSWKNFFTILEKQDDNDNFKKCEKPTISYKNGKLTFQSATEGAVCYSTITDTDITSYNTNEVKLDVTYEISVFATKTGYENSETATATLCWIDVEPRTEGLNSITQVSANAIMIKTDGGKITIEGSDDNTGITVYTIDGVQVGSAISKNGVADVSTNAKRDSILIVKIGDRSVKVIMK